MTPGNPFSTSGAPQPLIKKSDEMTKEQLLEIQKQRLAQQLRNIRAHAKEGNNDENKEN